MFMCDTEIDTRAAWRADVLKELVEAGMDMVRDVRAVAAEPDSPDMSARFARVAKAVRMTLALDARLCDEAGVAADERVKARKAKDEARLQARKVYVYNVLAHSLESDVDHDETRKGRDYEEILTEIEHPDVTDEEYLTLPVSQIIARICEDLGLPINWHDFRFEDWAMEERRTKPEGSAFANGVPPPLEPRVWHTPPARDPDKPTAIQDLSKDVNAFWV